MACSRLDKVNDIDIVSLSSMSREVDAIKLEPKNNQKFRQHVNPLASLYQKPIELSNDWVTKSFCNLSLSEFVIDIGCSKGSWILNSAEQNHDSNFLGLEIRRPVVEYATLRKIKRKLTNVEFLSSNANVDLERIMKDIQSYTDVSTICIQFPDPHFKKRHKKRRVVNKKLVNCIAAHLKRNSFVFVQSDVEEVAYEMSHNFQEHECFDIVQGYDKKNLSLNKSPFNVQTEREIATLKKNLPVYRMLFTRNDREFYELVLDKEDEDDADNDCLVINEDDDADMGESINSDFK